MQPDKFERINYAHLALGTQDEYILLGTAPFVSRLFAECLCCSVSCAINWLKPPRLILALSWVYCLLRAKEAVLTWALRKMEYVKFHK